MASGEGWLDLEGVRRAPSDTTANLATLVWLHVVTLVIGLVSWVIYTVVRNRRSVPQVNFDDRALRSGPRRLSFDDITEARVNGSALAAGTLELYFGTRKGFQLSVVLRQGATVVVPPHTQRLLVRVLETAPVKIPVDPYDPKGKFARSGFPMNVTRDEAIELVRHPPLKGEPLPITF